MKCRAECGAVRNCMRVDVDGNIYGFGVDGWEMDGRWMEAVYIKAVYMDSISMDAVQMDAIYIIARTRGEVMKERGKWMVMKRWMEYGLEWNGEIEWKFG